MSRLAALLMGLGLGCAVDPFDVMGLDASADPTEASSSAGGSASVRSPSGLT